jgi:hypothetical protein
MSKVDDSSRKSELLVRLRDVRERILKLASSMEPHQHDEVYLGMWSAREMLAHLAGWDETNRSAAGEILSGEMPSFYEHFDKDWAGYNSRLVSQYSRGDFSELLSLLKATHSRLLQVIDEIPAPDLWEDRGIRARGWKVTIGRLLEAELQDEEEHHAQLQQFLEHGLKS